MSNVPPEIAARIAEIRTQMGMPAAAGGAAPAPAAAAPAGDAGGASSGDMADKIAAIKAKMAGGAAPAPSAGAAAATPSPTGAAPAAADDGDMQARIAALKSKMEAGKTSGGYRREIGRIRLYRLVSFGRKRRFSPGSRLAINLTRLSGSGRRNWTPMMKEPTRRMRAAQWVSVQGI